MTESTLHLAGLWILTQTKQVLPLSNEHGSQVKDQGRRKCCHNKQKKIPCRPTRNVSLLSGYASYFLRVEILRLKVICFKLGFSSAT